MVMSPAWLRALKSETLSRSILNCPGRLTSPSTEKCRFSNSTVSTGSFTRLPETSLSFSVFATCSRVIPATDTFPTTGKSIVPSEATL